MTNGAPGQRAPKATPETPAPGGPAMAGLATLIVGETGRSRATLGVGRRPSPAGAVEPPRQWSCTWSEAGPGPISEGCPGEPDLALTLSPADAELVKQGRLAPSVAFMQGRLKNIG